MKDKAARTGPMAVSNKQVQFEALVRAMSGDLYRYSFWLCGNEAQAQDLVQEAFLRAWRSLDDLRDTASAKAWLITILRREHARLYERLRPQFEDVADLEIDDQDGITPERAGEDAMLREAMHKLDAKYREPLLLQVLGGFSCDEIAAELRLTSAAVMTQLFRARQKLKALLAGPATEANVYELP